MLKQRPRSCNVSMQKKKTKANKKIEILMAFNFRDNYEHS